MAKSTVEPIKTKKPSQRLPAASAYQWKKVDPSQKGKKEILHGICGGCMQRDCATLIYLEDGVVTKIEGNPQSPPNYGSLCGRGNSEIMALYNPYRVKTPLVRTNPEKGLDVDPMWKEVTWDEAMKIVADKLKEVRQKDPRGLMMCEGFGDRETQFRAFFHYAFGTPNSVGSHGPLCDIHYASMVTQSATPEAIGEMEYSEYMVSCGRTFGANFSTTGATRRFAKAIDRGMKLIAVDPRSSYEASKGEWVPIRPGSDFAFLLSMAHVIIHEGLQMDTWFLKNRTTAPYLIQPDGYYYRDPVTKKPMMWDTIDKCARVFNEKFSDIALTGEYIVNGVKCRTAFDLIKEEFAKYTPEWAEKICTIPAATIRRIAREFVEHAKIGSTIQIDDFVFPFRPVSVSVHRGVNNHRGGTYADLTSKIINMLVGSMEVPGGNVGTGQRGGYALEPDEDGVVKPIGEAIGLPWKFPPDHIDCHEYYPNKHTSPHLALKAMMHPEIYHHDYKIQAIMFVGGNPIKKNSNPQLYVEGYKKVPFIFSVAYHMDECTILADVVLPEHSCMERSICTYMHPPHQATGGEMYGFHAAYIRQPVPPVFNTRHMDDILAELCDRMGILHGPKGLYDRWGSAYDRQVGTDGFRLTGEYKIDPNKNYTREELYDRQLKSWSHGGGRGYEDAKKTGFLMEKAPKKNWFTYSNYPDNKTRHQIYFMHLKEVGDNLRANLQKTNIHFPGIDNDDYIFDLYKPIPHWVENSEINAPPEYDLWAINWRSPYFSNDIGNRMSNPWTEEFRAIDPFENGILINRAVGEKKGLKEGDTVVVESRYGKTKGTLHLTEILHPDAIGIPNCAGPGTILGNPRDRGGPSWNALLSMDEKTLDPISAGMETAPRVKIYKEGSK